MHACMHQGEAEASLPGAALQCADSIVMAQLRPIMSWRTFALVCWVGSRARFSLRLRTASVTAAPTARPTMKPIRSSANMEPETVALPIRMSPPEQ